MFEIERHIPVPTFGPATVNHDGTSIRRHALHDAPIVMIGDRLNDEETVTAIRFTTNAVEITTTINE